MLTEEVKIFSNKINIINWTPEIAPQILQELELPNWAPWLAASRDSLAGRAEVFPAGQLLIVEDNNLLASISTNQIHWDGNISNLPTWDEVAGDPTTYQNTYNPKGNTLVLMSANVNPKFQGKGFGRQLIEAVKSAALNIGKIENIIGSFRPTGYGKYKTLNPNNFLSFADYCFTTLAFEQLKPADFSLDLSGWGGSLPIDHWLKNLARNGMQPLQVDHKAMVVPVSLQEFMYYKETHNPESWVQLADGSWLCGEVGNWTAVESGMVYQEANLWGKIQ